MIVKKDFLGTDELNYVLSVYEDIIKDKIGSNIGISFFSSSEEYIDDYEPLAEKLQYIPFNVTIFNDYSVGEKRLITDIGIATLKIDDKVYTFLKVVTPFTRERTYDFLITKKEETEIILKSLDEKRKKESFKYNDFPVVGLDFSDIKKNTIDFLLNDEFRDYCISKHIKLKRGIILEGSPGTGKCCHKDVKVKVRINKEDYDAIQDKRKNM